MDRGAWRATVHGVTKSRTQMKRLSIHSLCVSKDEAVLFRVKSSHSLPPAHTHPVLFPLAPLALAASTSISLCCLNDSCLAFHLEIC